LEVPSGPTNAPSQAELLQALLAQVAPQLADEEEAVASWNLTLVPVGWVPFHMMEL
jgi:hypothetical protein